MPFEFASAAIGGAIGLLGGLGGVAMGHALTARRESRGRAIEGLREVVRELERRRRLSLDIAQHVNSFSAASSSEDNASLFTIPGWKEATLALYERTWVFSCIAYLPEAKDDFQRLDDQIVSTMDPLSNGADEAARQQRDESIAELHRLTNIIQAKLEAKLRKLVK